MHTTSSSIGYFAYMVLRYSALFETASRLYHSNGK